MLAHDILRIQKRGAQELHRLVEQSAESCLRTILNVEPVFRALHDAQHRLYLRSAQARV